MNELGLISTSLIIEETFAHLEKINCCHNCGATTNTNFYVFVTSITSKGNFSQFIATCLRIISSNHCDGHNYALG